MRRTSAIGLLVLAILSAGAGGNRSRVKSDPYEPGDLFDDKVVSQLLGEAEKTLDQELGKIPHRPRVLLATREFAAENALHDIRKVLKKLFPEADEGFARAEAAQTSVGVFAFFEPSNNTVYVIPDNFPMVARRREDPDFVSHDFLRLVLTHELVHAWDDQLNGLGKLRDTLTRADEIKLWSAVGEGHAQLITKRAMTRMGRLADFNRFCEANFNTESKDESIDRFARKLAAANGKFGYVDGLVFFEALEKTGKPELETEPFHRLPESPSVILHPERYWKPLEGRPKPLDLTPVLKVVVKLSEPKWKMMPIPNDEHTIRTRASPLLDSGKVDGLLSRFITGRAIAAAPPPSKKKIEKPKDDFEVVNGDARASLVCSASQMENDEEAKHLYSMLLHVELAEQQALVASAKGPEVEIAGAKKKARPKAAKVGDEDSPFVKDDDIGAPEGAVAHRRLRILDDGRRARGETSVLMQRRSVVAGCVYYSTTRDDVFLEGIVDSFATQLSALEE